MYRVRIARLFATAVTAVVTLLTATTLVTPAPATYGSSGSSGPSRGGALCAPSGTRSSLPSCPSSSSYRCSTTSSRWSSRYRSAGLRCASGGKELRRSPRQGHSRGWKPPKAPKPTPTPAPTPTPTPSTPAGPPVSSGPYAIVLHRGGEVWSGNDVDGALARVSPEVGDHYYDNPALSADETQVVYDEDNHDISIDAIGGGDRDVLFTPADPSDDAWQPSFHPSGDTVLFTYRNDLYTVGADGTGLTAVTSTPDELEQDGAFSPDGETIAFSDRGRLGLVDADGGNVRYLTAAFDWSSWGPRWSPDGTKIVFYAFGANGSDVFEIGVDGTGLRNVTSSSADEQLPDYAPDGSSLIFDRDDDGDYLFGLWHASVSGAGATEIEAQSAFSGSYRQPSTLTPPAEEPGTDPGDDDDDHHGGGHGVCKKKSSSRRRGGRR